MRHNKRISNRIRMLRTHQWSLKETLRPWWRLTRWGILMDWCHPYSEHEHAFIQIVRRIAVFITSLLLFVMTIFEIVQFTLGVISMTTVHSVIPYVVWFTAFPTTLFLQLRYIIYSKEYLAFFADWNNFENQLALQNSHRDIKKLLTRTRTLTLVSTMTKFGMVCALFYFILNYPESPFLLTYYKTLRNTLTFPVLVVIHLTCGFIMVISKVVGEVVPALIFYHAGVEVKILRDEIEHLFAIFDPSESSPHAKKQTSSYLTSLFAVKVRQVLICYENIRKLVVRANSLFGALMFLSYAMEFIVICIMLYSFLYQLHSKPEATGFSLFFTTIHLCDLVYCTTLTAKVYRASEHLRIVLSSLLNLHWDVIAKNERDILLVFLGCLRSDPLAAFPLGLFKITSSILLTMTSLTMSYVIIMLQSK